MTFPPPRPRPAPVAAVEPRQASSRLWLALVVLLVAGIMGVSLLGGAFSSLGTVAGPVALPSPGGGLTILSHSVGPVPRSATLTGAVASSTTISFTLQLAVPSSAAETSFEQGLQTPGSPYYHQFLSSSQFYATYGPSPSSVASLLSYLSSQGLTVTPTSGPWLYTVSGPASSVASTFHVALFHYRASDGSTLIAPRGVPQLPAGFAPLVGTLSGLNQFDLPHPTFVPAPHITASGPTSPTTMRGFYNSASLISGGDTGSAFAIGLAEMCDPTESTATYSSDLASFDSMYGLPSTTVNYIGSGASSCPSGQGSSGWGVETDLDIQWAHAMAPGATLYVCLDTSNPAICDQTFVTDHSADNIEFGSNSWGGGSADHSVWQSAVAAGMTLLASAGDSCSQVSYPAAEPDGIGVGGTTITPSGNNFGSETAWSCSGGSGTGGGCDTADAPPSYQIGMTGYPGVCATGDRGVPDVAMDANPTTGVDIVTGGSTAQYGGTSLACPMWAASLDLIYQSSGATGFAGPTIYSLAKGSNYNSLFHDITSGSNGYATTVGWDPVTGVGSPNIGALASAWTGGSPTPLSASASATPTSGTVPLAVAFTGSASGGTSPYTYSWAFGDGGTSTAQNPSYTYSTAGTYTATLTVTDSASNTATASVSITVNPASTPLTASASGSPTSGTVPLAVAFTGSASGGTSPYTYSWAFGDGSTSTAQSPSHTYTTAGTYSATLTVTDSASNTATASVSITANPASTPLTASASATPTSGTAPLAVAFTGSASGGTSPYTYAWAFGDGSTSTAQNPSHTYSAAGTYTSTLTVTDSASNTASSSVTITVSASAPPLAASASASPTSGTAPLAVAFTGSASGGTSPYTYSWAFGDGSTSTAQSPSHTYTAAGTYTATLAVTDSASHTATSSVSIAVSAPSGGCSTATPVSFGTQVSGSAPAGGCALYTAALTQSEWNSYYYLDAYETDGSVSGAQPVFTVYTDLGTAPTPTTYQQEQAGPNAALTIDLFTGQANVYGGWGTYEFLVQASASGSGSFCFEVQLSNSVAGTSPSCSAGGGGGTPLSAQASATPTTGTAPLAVAFTGSASGGTSPYTYAWAFGDGSTSTAQNPSHTYTAAGTYTATLTVTDSASHTATSSVSITATSSSGGGCDGQTYTVGLGSVKSCSLDAGSSAVLQFAVSQSQWNSYYYVNVYESDGVVNSGAHFSIGSGMGGTPSLSAAQQTATSPNAKIQIDLFTQASGQYGGWGTYWVVVQAVGGSGGFCFEAQLSNGALGSGPSCSAPAITEISHAGTAPTVAGQGTAGISGMFAGSSLLTLVAGAALVAGSSCAVLVARARGTWPSRGL